MMPPFLQRPRCVYIVRMMVQAGCRIVFVAAFLFDKIHGYRDCQ